MGNSSGKHHKHEEFGEEVMANHFVMKVISIENIPPSEITSECRPYLRMYIGRDSVKELSNSGNNLSSSFGSSTLSAVPQNISGSASTEYEFKIMSTIVTTPVKNDRSTTWSCYRDFFYQPDYDRDILVIELLNAAAKTENNGFGELLGVVKISTKSFSEESGPQNFGFNEAVSLEV